MRHWSGSSLWLLLHPPCWVLSGTSLDYPCAMEILQLWICRSGPFIWFSSLMGIRFSSSLCVVWYNLVVSVETLIFAYLSLGLTEDECIFLVSELTTLLMPLLLPSLLHSCLDTRTQHLPAATWWSVALQESSRPSVSKTNCWGQQAGRLRSSQMFILSGWWQA